MNAQIPVSDWPFGLSEDALLLRLSPEDISARTSAVFEAGSDDLGEVESAIIRREHGREIAFQRHKHAPVPGTVVIRYAGDDSSLKWIAKQLGLTSHDVIWSAPGVHLPTSSAKTKTTVIAGIAAAAASALALATTSQKRRANRGPDGRFASTQRSKGRPRKQRA
jgi:hypothetical protein